MRGNFTKVFKYSAAELLILLEAWFVFLKWDLLISFTRYENWRSELGILTASNEPRATLPEQVKQLIQLSEVEGRFHIRKIN